MNLLLDGMPGCGKTTMINDVLRTNQLLPFCAGFRTVRVISGTGEKWGFAQLPASEDAGVSVVSDNELPHMIFNFRKDRSLIRETFTGFTVNSLKTVPEGPGLSRLILMDEIGGKELEIPEVRKAFLDALKGEIPVIGVIKSNEHAKRFAYESYRAFRTCIEKETDTEILFMNEENGREIRERICQAVRSLGAS